MELTVVKRKRGHEMQRTISTKQLLCLSSSLTVFLLTFCPGPASAITPPPKKLVADRLNYLVALRNFSPAHPLTQARLMRLVFDLGWWGDFPENYREKAGGPPNCDAFITRASVRRFIQSLTGQDLKEWAVGNSTEKPKFAGNEMGWWYNTSNTMYRRPLVHIISEKLMPSQSVQVMFRIMHQQGNSVNDQPVIEVGHGSATLKSQGPDWVVTSWQVSRNSHWNYYGSEATTNSTPISSQSFSHKLEVDEQIKFLLRVPPYSTLRQIQSLLPQNTQFGSPRWVQSLNEWGNFINFVGSLKGSAVFLDRTKPYHGMREKYSAADAINYMVFEVPSSSAQANSALESYNASITKILGRSPKVAGTNGNVASLEWKLIDGRALILRSQSNTFTLRLTFPYTIEGEPDDQQ